MSRRSEQKKARRKKRRAVRDESWVPARVLEQLEIASDLEAFDEQLTQRGWEFSEDIDDEAGAAWYWVPSEAEVPDEDEVVNVTVALLTPDDDGEIVHVVFVGTADDYQFGVEEFFANLDVIEAYRLGDPIPEFA
ncbi:hypothetical protein [Mycobacterium sp. PSTR-4-N]|uniref:hypothetical protein n=1 Tax=Mycobacterium sp. PSTR-4-N TaxID=2917745 RepID=UPI001F150DA5|nr:hypothetical protein [Mycobacterium sp. PSTR-4-N]MCG7595596.1 hypothetical protein [Mycobacterium sp. PSTR-4-N]